jgi:hypothetical protein
LNTGALGGRPEFRASSSLCSLWGAITRVMKPLDVLVERGGNSEAVAAKLRAVPGIVGATAPPAWHRGSNSLVEAFPAIDGSAHGIKGIIDGANDS